MEGYTYVLVTDATASNFDASARRICVNFDSSAFVADQELVEALEKCSTPVDCDEDRNLFIQGETPVGLYIVREGDVALSMASPSGDEIMRASAPAGSVLGLPGLLSSQPYTLTAKAKRGSRLSFVTGEDFSRLMLNSPELSMLVLRVLAAEVRTARRVLCED